MRKVVFQLLKIGSSDCLACFTFQVSKKIAHVLPSRGSTSDLVRHRRLALERGTALQLRIKLVIRLATENAVQFDL